MKHGVPEIIVSIAATAFAPTIGVVLLIATVAIAHVSPCLAANVDERPLYFEANKGQVDSQVKFLARSGGQTVLFASTGVVFVFTQPGTERTRSAVRMAFLGADRDVQVTGQDRLRGRTNYVVGNDPAKWTANVPTYAKVQYQELYAGIDVLYYGSGRHLECDLIVRPGADPTRIVLSIEGANGIDVEDQGDLVIQTVNGQLRQRRPIIYQEVDGVRQEIAGGYVLKGGGEVGFQIAAYDAGRPLVIDPILAYSTYVGGSGRDRGHAIALDTTGNVYITGFTTSVADFPTMAAWQPAFGGLRTNGFFGDAFVTKFDPAGALIYSTYLGGSDEDAGYRIAVDSLGNAYVTGQTFSADFPTTSGAFQTALSGGVDAFVTKLDPRGLPLYSTYLGGSGGELGHGIAVDARGAAYVTGDSSSADFPTTPGAFNTTLGAGVFVTKLDRNGALVYSTYLRTGSEPQIAVDAAQHAYIAGGGAVFVAKLDAAGSALVYSFDLGAGGEVSGIAVDSSGNAYVTGFTGEGFPTTAGAFQTVFGGGNESDAFVTKVNPTGSALVYSTYLGGSGADGGRGIAVDSAGNAYVTGFTNSSDFPTTGPAFQSVFGGDLDAFVTTLNASGSALLYSTYLGGSGSDGGRGIALDGSGNAYITGFTASSDFPTAPGAFDTSYNGDPED